MEQTKKKRTISHRITNFFALMEFLNMSFIFQTRRKIHTYYSVMFMDMDWNGPI